LSLRGWGEEGFDERTHLEEGSGRVLRDQLGNYVGYYFGVWVEILKWSITIRLGHLTIGKTPRGRGERQAADILGPERRGGDLSS